ncbi:MAG TPA: beta-galactosidase [Planctomycetota bacterium]|nr:beta-galactosidase [Planctomycetota bacterium]OQC21035.1 MAG: hypothetical protein BWX69_01231 [Planctomycetes bacterium ADurb.Bin069]HNR99425.1 beta-galactosidase [Planctomycetota bacterium]HNU25965.1 beta-galactosidase [Planctomycetota bacterium]HOE30330.1 beta-galactosidase [Planctomycetota bacterium]
MRMRERIVRAACVAVSLAPACLAWGAPASAGKVLVSFAGRFDLETVGRQDATVALVGDEFARALRVATGHRAQWPGVSFKAPGGAWDLSGYAEIAFRVANLGSRPTEVYCRVDSPGGDGSKNCVTAHVSLDPGQSGRLRVPLRRQLPAALSEKLFGMRGYPGGYVKDDGLDAARVTQILVFVSRPSDDRMFQLGPIAAEGTHAPESWLSLPPEKFFPMIDRFGQFVHKDWPGKTRSEKDLAAAIKEEAADMAAHPGPGDWNQYGGWKSGPKLKATGFFYPALHAGKWWLVDPEGCLFWSHGSDCVGPGEGMTPISDREFYFAGLPAEGDPLAVFYGRGSWAPHGYYKDKGSFRTFNFTGANLLRKYGEGWAEKGAEAAHRRLRSWAMNTIANWSSARVYLMRKTPYVVSIASGGAKPIEGSTGYWGKFPDPFDPSFRKAIARPMEREAGRTAGDPWCIGYFVDNELGWGDELSLAKAALASPEEQAAKQEFLKDLKAKYGNVAALNAAWGVAHESWEALAASRTPPDENKARADLAAFYTRIGEEYFRVCRDEVKRIAPNNLYLGCRFAWVNDRGARASAGYCDVIGYNLYENSVADFKLPSGLDKPVIIGEFHFGALDRGMFHTGLRPTASQEARAAAYRSYVTGALKNRFIVGTHWFQYGDQATTGRGDGENYQIGLVDICDRPYPETIAAVREIGASMYKTRLEAP